MYGNPRNFCLSIGNPGLWGLIQFLESGIQVPLRKNPESRKPEIRNPRSESQTVLDYLQGMGEIQLIIRAGIEPGTSGWTIHSAPLSLSGKSYSFPKQEVLRIDKYRTICSFQSR